MSHQSPTFEVISGRPINKITWDVKLKFVYTIATVPWGNQSTVYLQYIAMETRCICLLDVFLIPCWIYSVSLAMFGASVASRTFQLETDEGVEVQSTLTSTFFQLSMLSASTTNYFWFFKRKRLFSKSPLHPDSPCFNWFHSLFPSNLLFVDQQNLFIWNQWSAGCAGKHAPQWKRSSQQRWGAQG